MVSILIAGLFLCCWGLLGAVYGLISVTDPLKVHTFSRKKVFVGGPAWWLLYFISKNSNKE